MNAKIKLKLIKTKIATLFLSLCLSLTALANLALANVSLEESIKQIFSEIVQQSQKSQNKKLDFVFLVDLGSNLANDLQKLIQAIEDLGYLATQANLDCRFGVVKFLELDGNPKVEIYSTLSSAEVIKQNLSASQIKVGHQRSGYALDAIFKATSEIPFRAGSLRHLLLITDQSLRSSQIGSAEKLATEIISTCSRSQIQLSIIGVSEALAERLALGSRGVQKPILSKEEKLPVFDVFGKAILKIDGIILEVAKHIAETCKPTVDLIFVIDSSESMSNKSEEVIKALPKLTQTFDKAKLNYQFGAIRFYAAAGGGESRVIVSQPPLSLDEVKKLLQMPKSGDEHLLDAIVEGVPKLKIRPEAKAALMVFTDELSTAAQKLNPAEWTSQAIAICKERNFQVNVIGASSFRPTGGMSFDRDFQVKAPQSTNGVRFIMPKSDVKSSENR